MQIKKMNLSEPLMPDGFTLARGRWVPLETAVPPSVERSDLNVPLMVCPIRVPFLHERDPFFGVF